MLIILFVFLPYVVFSVENCSINFDTSVFTSFPDQVVCKKNETYTVIEMDPEITGAKCLDGTNYKFLVHEGTGEGKRKFLYFFEGAAYCGCDGSETLKSCYSRSLTNKGSSSSYGSNGSIFKYNYSMGYAASDPKVNPLYWNWNIVYVLYCDGSSTQGYVENPLYYDNIPLWFRGYNNTLSAFEYTRQNMGAFDASEVVLSGTSSGGTAILIWANFLRDYFPSNVRMHGLAEAGLSLDLYSHISGCYLYRFYMQEIASLTNSKELDLFRKCPYRNSSDTVWKCLIPQYIYKNIEIDFFIANSQMDEQQLASQMGVMCLFQGGPLFCNSHELATIIQYREKHLRLAFKIKKHKPSWGLWLRSCFEHSYYTTWAWYGTTMNVFSAEVGTDLSFREALTFWFQNRGNNKTTSWPSFIDVIDWKHNPFCVYDELYREQNTS